MDAILKKITDFSWQLKYGDLPPVAVHECKRRIIDTLACALMQKVRVIHDPELDKLQPAVDPCRMEITLKNGAKKLSDVDYPKGHVRNPASDQDLENKLIRMNNGLLSPARVAGLLDLRWRLEELDDVRELVSATRAG